MDTLKLILQQMAFLLFCNIHNSESGGMADGYDTPPAFDTNDFQSNSCRNSSDCYHLTGGQTCIRLYDGCSYGQCMCDPLRSKQDTSGKCITLHSHGESCDGNESCVDGLYCLLGVCRCPNGRTLTPDRKSCIERNAVLVGESCAGRNHQTKCYHKSAYGYTRNDVYCSTETGLCACKDGFKRSGSQCLRRSIGEAGCRSSIHCEGGAICDGHTCKCPVGYTADAYRFKCIKNGARRNVAVGNQCDEVNESAYCSNGLVCFKCASDVVDRCVRFLLANEFDMSSASSAFQSIRHKSAYFVFSLVSSSIASALDF